MELTRLQQALVDRLLEDGVTVGILRTVPTDMGDEFDGWLQVDADGGNPKVVIRRDYEPNPEEMEQLRRMLLARLDRLDAIEDHWQTDIPTGRRRAFFGDMSAEIPPELRD